MKAAIYVRVSTGGQEDNYSPKTQEDACRAYCLRRGYEVDDLHVYQEVFTGATLHERPELSRLRDAVRAGAVSHVVAYSLDRLSRDQNHIGILLDEWKRRSVRMEFATENFEDTVVGRFLIGAQAFAAELEREKIRERTGRGRRARVESGFPMPGAKAPYGFRWLPDIVDSLGRVITPKPGLQEDDATSWVVRRIFAEAARGRGQEAIAADLTSEGIPTPTRKPNAPWGQTTIRCILKNVFYVGRAASFRARVYKDYTRETKNGQVIEMRPEAEWIALPDGVVPPLVDADTFATVQERFRLNMERAQRVRRDPELLLLRGGYVKCGYCGHNMFVHRHGDRLSYRCIRRQRFKDCPGATHSAGPLDAQAWAKVEELLLNPDVIASELERLEREDPTADDVDNINRSIAQVQGRRRNLIGQLGDLDPASAGDVRRILAELGDRLTSLEAERMTVVAQREARRQARSRLAELEAWCHTVAANLGDLTYDQRRLALDALGVRVTIWRKDDRPPRVQADIPLGATSISTSRSGVAFPGQVVN